MPDAVILTRPRAQAEALAAQLRAAGRVVELLPLLEIYALDDPAPLQAALAELSQYALVAFVSPNAIDAALAHVPHWPDGLDCAVLGEGSRAALLAHGVRATIHSPPDPAHTDSEGLLGALDLAALRGHKVLLVRGDGGRELLADALRAAGCEVVSVIAYRRAVPPLTAELGARLRTLLAGEHDWVITSSEALRGLVGLVDALETTPAARAALVARMQHQRWIVPHARIAHTAGTLGLQRLTLTGSGDERLLAALQSRP